MHLKLVPMLVVIVALLVAAATTAAAAPTAEQVFLKKVKKIAGERPTVGPESYEQALKESKALCPCLAALDGSTNRIGAVTFIRGALVGQSFSNCLVPRFDANGALDLALTNLCPGDWVPITK